MTTAGLVAVTTGGWVAIGSGAVLAVLIAFFLCWFDDDGGEVRG